MDPLAYDRVLVNEGNAWKPDTSSVLIPHTGYYLVHFGVGNPSGEMVSQYLYSGEDEITRLFRFPRDQNGSDCFGKTVIVRFEAGSVVKISSITSTFSTDMMHTTFMGLLIQAGLRFKTPRKP